MMICARQTAVYNERPGTSYEAGHARAFYASAGGKNPPPGRPSHLRPGPRAENAATGAVPAAAVYYYLFSKDTDEIQLVSKGGILTPQRHAKVA